MDFGAGTWNGGPIGIPYNLVEGSAVTHYPFDFYYADESDPGPYPIPSPYLIEYGSDHHILVADTESCRLYEIYDAWQDAGGWHGGSGAIWDLRSHVLRPAGWTSADAAGLPILPGLARYPDILSGSIDHALRFTAPATNSYVWPARHLTAGTPGTLTDTPPMGARFRLKAGYDISGFAPELQVILRAMKTYGIILADNGSPWYVSGAPDERWNNDRLHDLDVLTGNDFEAVDTACLMVDTDSGQALPSRCGVPTAPEVRMLIDPSRDVQPISRYIYGVNQPLEDDFAHLTLRRLGGNRWTAYNWENNASNAGSDWFFQNDDYLGGGDTPGGAVMPALANAAARQAGTLLTIPINGYVAADKRGDGDVRNSGPDYLQTRFRQGVARKGGAFSLTPDLGDEFVFQDEFVNWLKTTYPYGWSDPLRPIFLALDNEPDLWADTHLPIHPDPVTYAELIRKTVDYAAAIKAIIPSGLVFGPVNYGWQGYVNLQNAPDAGGRDFQAVYLQQLAEAEQRQGRRLVDVLDVHWYPEAQGDGIRIIEDNNSPAVVAARLQAPRSLWDSSYTETSWITQWSTLEPIALLPRLRAKLEADYPGTRLAITEYNYGGGNHISGGIAQADVLGILGREGVFAANEWPLAGNEAFIAGGFRMFRNFDGQGGSFGDTSVRATTEDIANSSVYASLDTAHPDVLTVVALNKADTARTARFALSRVRPGAAARIYQLTSSSPVPQAVETLTIANPADFVYTLPALSVSTLRITGLEGVQQSLTVAVTGGGTVNSIPKGIACGIDCSESYPAGTEVSLTANPNPGYLFAGWTGNCEGGLIVCRVVMNTSRAVTAEFVLYRRPI